ncbi:iron ABC transporter permease [Paenibacillus sp. GSMTC-2017]|uniref:FecCD family ABC transporter permease n=1 Tax=Paenibacillus sp. GSMTC-2017 TaxID=2794350 RepID=UPI0018D8913D|nr:iron ABC transporter permease [Paenibacillus sp. GSMTC-2017]MBH5320108.1 iron ABC transporter permease [Paenibacillus sp. GSMTC-2017]
MNRLDTGQIKSTLTERNRRRKVTAAVTWIGLLSLLFILSVASLSVGSLVIAPFKTLEVLFVSGWGGDSAENTVIWKFRMPRLLLAGLAGAALALSGTILQSVVRNPLASPDVVGVTSGASMMAVVFLAFFNESLNIVWMPLFSFAGAVAVTFFIYVASWKRGVSPLRLILVGLGVAALLEACKTLFLIFSPIFLTSQAQVWLTGSVYGTSWHNIYSFLPWFVSLTIVLIFMVRQLNIGVLGDELTISLGSRLQRQRMLLIGVAAALAGSAISFVGGIGFIGLMAPHLARRLVGSSHALLLPCAALVGAILLISADLIGRTMFSPRDIPAGVFTAVIGAPFLIYLLMNVKKQV